MESKTGESRASHSNGAMAPTGLAFLQVAFAGHGRADDLPSPDEIAFKLAATWDLLKAAGVSEARLLTGYADGADLLAWQAWKAADLGPAQLVLPELPLPAAVPRELADDATRLDGDAARVRLRSPHLNQSRWIIAAADLLVVVWNGQAGRGSGGTADSVRLALQHGVPVIWIQPGTAAIRLIQPQHLFEDCGFGELLDLLAGNSAPLIAEASAASIHQTLVELGLHAPSEPETEAEEAPAKLGWPWLTYAAFRRWLGGKPQPFPRSEPPADLATQAGFQLLSRKRAVAARDAQRLGAVHRSKQLILLAIAIAMATAGSAPAMWPDLKLQMVSLELALALAAFWVWRGSTRADQHLRWGAARKAAEDLRLERVAWALGVSTVPHDPLSTNAFEARRARRLAGIPSGAFDAARVQAWGAWVIQELLVAQAAYHGEQARMNGRISHRLHLAENISFSVLLLLLVTYLVVALALSPVIGQAPKWLSGLVFMAGAIVPAIGAASLALEATLSLQEQGHRSATLRLRLETLIRNLGETWTLEDLQGVARAAIKLQRAQEDHWSEEANRRRLFRGG